MNWELFILTDQTGKEEQDIFLMFMSVSAPKRTFPSLSLLYEAADARSLKLTKCSKTSFFILVELLFSCSTVFPPAVSDQVKFGLQLVRLVYV